MTLQEKYDITNEYKILVPDPAGWVNEPPKGCIAFMMKPSDLDFDFHCTASAMSLTFIGFILSR